MNTRLSRTRARVAPHACRARAEMHPRQGLGRPTGFAYPRKGALNENKREREKGDTRRGKKEEGAATWPLHGPPRRNPPDPTWPIQGEIYPSALPAMGSIGTFLTTSAYLPGIPALLFPIPANRPSYVHHPLVRVTYLKLFRTTSPCLSK